MIKMALFSEPWSAALILCHYAGSATNLELYNQAQARPADSMQVDGEGEVTGHLRLMQLPSHTGDTTSLSSDGYVPYRKFCNITRSIHAFCGLQNL